MRQYTITNTLALFLGVLSVVARSLPERRLEINVRSPGVHRFGDPLTELDTTTDIGDLKQRLEELGLVKVSEGILDGNIHTATYSISNNTTFPKRDATPEKRQHDIQGGHCSTVCGAAADRPDPGDCENLFQSIQSISGTFDVAVGVSEAKIHRNKSCAIVFINRSPDTVTYDFWDFGGTAMWLNGECIMRRGNNVGGCVFGDMLENSPYIGIAHPSSFGIH